MDPSDRCSGCLRRLPIDVSLNDSNHLEPVSDRVGVLPLVPMAAQNLPPRPCLGVFLATLSTIVEPSLVTHHDSICLNMVCQCIETARSPLGPDVPLRPTEPPFRSRLTTIRPSRDASSPAHTPLHTESVAAKMTIGVSDIATERVRVCVHHDCQSLRTSTMLGNGTISCSRPAFQ